MGEEEKKGVGEHGRKGETKALILLEILKESFKDLKKYPFGEGILRTLRNGFAPVSRSDLKKGLKDYNVSSKNADAIIRNLENDKAIKIKPRAVVLNNLTIEGIVSIMEILTNSPYYMVASTENEIKKASSDKKPFLDALDKAFAECFLCAYGDFPFDLYVDPQGKWSEKVITSVIEEKKRPDLAPDQVNEILQIGSRIRGELTIKFKLMYVWMVSLIVQNGRDGEAEMKRNYILLSLAERPRSYIEDPHNIAESSDRAFITFFMGRFIRFMLLANNPALSFLDVNLNPNEEHILTLKILLASEKGFPLESLLKSHWKYILPEDTGGSIHLPLMAGQSFKSQAENLLKHFANKILQED